MAKVKLLYDYKVLLSAGSEIEVDELEAERLLAFGVAVKAEEKTAEKKTTAKKKG